MNSNLMAKSVAVEWGAQFFDNACEDGARMYWGARAAIRPGRRLEFYPDRQNFVADDDTGKRAFIDFINNEAIPRLESCVKNSDAQHVLCMNTDRTFKCVGEERGGYLYVGAWAL